MIKVGCCGFPVKRDIYYQSFPVVEIQQTFYHLPLIETGMRWREGAPSEFEFTMKAWQLITHEPSSPTYRRLRIEISEDKKKNYGSFKDTEEVEIAWSKTEEFARALGVNKIIFQSPASFIPSNQNIKNLKRFFKKVRRGSFIFIWEPRGRWEIKEVEELCKDLHIYPCFDIFRQFQGKGDFLYTRLHGKTGYHYIYLESELKEIVERGKSFQLAYIMFNNTNMFEDASRLKRLLE